MIFFTMLYHLSGLLLQIKYQLLGCTACKKLVLLNNVYPFDSAMSGRTQLLICRASASSPIYSKTREDLKINTFLLNSLEHAMFVSLKV
jgi:hypothetical protein